MDADDNLILPVPSSDEEDPQLPPVLDNNHIIFSPQKQQRTRFNSGASKKRKRQHCQSPPQVVKATVTVSHDNTTTLAVDLGMEAGSELPQQSWDEGDDDKAQLPPIEVDDVSSNDSSIEYLEYVDCVMAGAAGFFQLEADLFVVQGWDIKSQVAKVCLSPILLRCN